MRSTADTSERDVNARPLALVLAVLTVLVAALALAALCIGSYALPADQVLKILASRFTAIEQTWSAMAQGIVLTVRVPRVIAAILVGSAYQGIFRNPLVSPDLLGVSSGACIGAAAIILLGGGMASIQGAAFVGGIAAVALTISIPRLIRKESTIALVLSGVIVSGFCSSILGLLKYVADPEEDLPEIVYWQMGSLAKADFDALVYAAPAIVVCIAMILLMRWRINVLSLGDHESKALGVNLKLERGIVIAFATLLTASAVSLAGTVGWVGLVLPHLARFLVGPNASRSLPVACVMAAGFMLIVDTLARFSGT